MLYCRSYGRFRYANIYIYQKTSTLFEVVHNRQSNLGQHAYEKEGIFFVEGIRLLKFLFAFPDEG